MSKREKRIINIASLIMAVIIVFVLVGITAALFMLILGYCGLMPAIIFIILVLAFIIYMFNRS